MIAKTPMYLLAYILPGLSQAQQTAPCAPFSDDVRRVISDYIGKLLRGRGDRLLNIEASSPESDTCYRQLQISIAGQQRSVMLYLAPDQRFLASQLFDSHVDPVEAEAEEIARTRNQIANYIDSHSVPLFGKPDAPTTIAIFSDFQCPYCKEARHNLSKAVSASRVGVRIAFMNYPIPSHLWARRAAEYAACVGSKPVFWKLHDFLFDHQMEITPQNLRTNLAGFWEGLPASDREGLSVTSCGGSDGAVRRVDEDVAFGNGLNISATPTLFVNGQRIVGLPNVDQIVDIISRSQSPTH